MKDMFDKLPKGNFSIASSPIKVRAYRNILMQSMLMTELPAELQEKLLSAGRICLWARGEQLFMDGFAIDHFYYIISGKVKEFYYNGGGDEYLRRLIYPGCYISLHSLFNEETVHSYSCESLVETEGIAWPADFFMDLLDASPQLGMRVARILSSNYERTCRNICLCKKKSARARVAGYLLSKLNPDCDYHKCNLLHGCKQVDLRPISIAAEDICLARETLTRNLAVLHKEGMIKQNRGLVTIVDKEALKAASGIE